MRPIFRCLRLGAVGAALAAASAAHADLRQVTVTVHNLAPAGSITFAPLHFGFGSGVFDAFDLGSAATAPIISVAEGGSGSAWQPAFAAAEPGAARATLGGALLPGASASLTLSVDTGTNPYFTFASMVVPSNDFFIGNDSPGAYRVFDASGGLALGGITVRARDIWDAGSEVFDPAAAAFVGNNDLRSPQGSVVALNFAELAAFDGLTTAAGYVFSSGLSAGSEVYRIDFALAPVPEPASAALLLTGLLAMAWRRRRAGPAV